MPDSVGIVVRQFVSFAGFGIIGTSAHYATLFILVQVLTLGPVIASNIGGLVDGVDPGKTGLLIRENDIDALCEAIVQVIDWEPDWEQVGLRARRFMQETCDLAEMNQLFIGRVEDSTA